MGPTFAWWMTSAGGRWIAQDRKAEGSEFQTGRVGGKGQSRAGGRQGGKLGRCGREESGRGLGADLGVAGLALGEF